MTNGWTGGHYSLYRAAFGVYLFVHLLRLPHRESFSVALIVCGALATLFLVIGLFDRAAALATGVVVMSLHPHDGLGANPSLAFLLWLLLAHAIVPRAPYGSWAARGRVDPAGTWLMPTAMAAMTWIVMVIGCSWVLWTSVRAGRAVFADLAELFPGMAFVLVFSLDPTWVPPRWSRRHDQIFYDGTCALCHGTTRFVLSEDRLETAFTFAPLQGDTCAAAITRDERRSLPDSVVVRTEDGLVLVRSDAAIYVLERLGGAWRISATVMRLVPKRLRDAAYDIVARVRYRVCGRTETACPILPVHLRSRFHT